MLNESAQATGGSRKPTMFSVKLDKSVVDLAIVDFPELETGAEGGKPWSGYITDWREVTLPQ